LVVALLVIDQDGRPHWVEVGPGKTRVGRGSDNDLVLTGRGVSRHHAVLDLNAGVLTIRDLDSTYGTRVSGDVIRKKRVGIGDPIDIGVFRLLPLPSSAIDEERRFSAQSGNQGKPSNPMEMGDTAEYRTSPGSGVKVLMSAPQFVGAPASRSGDRDVTVVHGLVDREELTEEMPVNVHLVDGWGGDALARVLSGGPAGSVTGGRGDAAHPHEASHHILEMLKSMAELGATNQSRRAILRQSLELLAGVIACETAVVLEVVPGGKLKPLAIRHKGELRQGEVPVSRTVIQRAVDERAAVMSENLSNDPVYGVRDSVHLYRVGAVLALPMVLEEQVVGVLYLTRAAGERFSDDEVAIVRVVAGLGSGVLRTGLLQNEIQSQHNRGAQYERFINPVVRERLLTHPNDPCGLERREVTVLYGRILDLDRVAATAEADALLSIFADLQTILKDVIARNGGTLVHAFQGEALAVFGVPEKARTDAHWAVNTGLELRKHFEVSLLKKSNLTEGLCLSVASGKAWWGVVGSPAHMEHTLLGRPVNTARQLAAAFARHGVVIAAETLDQIPAPRFSVEPFAAPRPAADGGTAKEIKAFSVQFARQR
jgi:class 3 adenylate cyclase